MSRRVPATAPALTAERLVQLRAELAGSAPGSALDELVARNEQLTAALDEGLNALADAATRVDDDLDDFCARLLVELAPPENHDDIAVVALRRH